MGELWKKSLSVTIQIKATVGYFPMVLILMLNKRGGGGSKFKFLDITTKLDNSNES